MRGDIGLSNRYRPRAASFVVLAFASACDRNPSPSPSPTASAVPPTISTSHPDVEDASPAPAPDGGADASVAACKKRVGAPKLAWTDESYHLVLDGEALSCLSDAERAAIAYVATSVGTECEWAPGTDLSAPEHMDCKLTTALGLGYQCEEKHKALLVEFFGAEIPARCAKVPITAFSQTALLDLSLGHEGQTITVTYKAATTTGPMGEAWTWSETIGFRETGPRALKIAMRRPSGKRK